MRKRSLERQHTTSLYDDRYDANDSYPYTVTPHQSHLESSSKYDYEYGLDSKWNTNYTNYDSQQPSSTIGHVSRSSMSPLTRNHLADSLRDTLSSPASSFLSSAVPIASGNTKKTRHLPTPTAPKHPRRNRQLPQMPPVRSHSRTGTMPRSDTEFSRFGGTDEYERRGAVSAMLFEDYDSAMAAKGYLDYPKSSVDEISSSYGNQCYSNDSLNTIAPSLYSESCLSERRHKLISLTMATPIASGYVDQQLSQSQSQDPYNKYSSNYDDGASSYYPASESAMRPDLARKRLPTLPTATSSQHLYESSTDYSLEPSVLRTSRRLPVVTPQPDATMTNCSLSSHHIHLISI